MREAIIVWFILAALLTYCNIVLLNQTTEKLEQTKLEYQAVCNKEAELLQVAYNQATDNIFTYIIGRNPNLSTREVAEFVTCVYQYSEQAGIDPYKVFAICDVESGFDPYTPGQAGERGYMQVMQATFEIYRPAFRYLPEDFYKWQCTLQVGIAHIKHLLDKHSGNWDLAVAEYNAGSRGNWLKRANYHVSKVRIANRGISRYREKGNNVSYK